MSNLVKQNPHFASELKIQLIGKADLIVKKSINNCELNDYISYEEFIPHDQTLGLLSSATVLLLCINNTPNAGSILTNKFFEYLSAHRPILAFGPADGDASAILTETGAGKIFRYNDVLELKKHILGLFELYSQHNLKIESRDIERFTRKNLTHELSKLLNMLTV